MENAELFNMGVFKLHECAQRMLVLAQAASSPALGATLLSVYRRLVQEEAGLQTAAAANKPGATEFRTLAASRRSC